MADRVMDGGGFGFLLPELAYAPNDAAWQVASPAVRARLHAEAGRVAAHVWDASRARGLDRSGEPLAPLHPRTIADRRADVNPVTGRTPYSPMGRASATAPPLTATGAASRARAYLRHRTVPGLGVWFWHRFDPHTRRYWGEVLARHARGFVQRFRAGHGFVPPRDVLGFSDAELAHVRDQVAAWWAARRPRVLAAPPRPVAALGAGHDRARPRWTTAQIIAHARSQPAASEAEKAAARRRAGLKDLDRIDLHSGTRAEIERAMRDGEFSGWTTQTGRPKGGWLAGLKPLNPAPPPRPGPLAAGVRRLAPPTPALVVGGGAAPARRSPDRPDRSTRGGPAGPPKPRPIVFGPSRATVEPGPETAGAVERLREWLGPRVQAQDLASLIGAPAHARVRARAGTNWSGEEVVFVDGFMPEVRVCERQIKKLPDGRIVVHNDTLVTNEDRAKPGDGLKILGRQVEAAARLGVSHLDCVAFRGVGWDGYYVWFLYGYDAPVERAGPTLNRMMRESGIEAVRTATRMRDLFRTRAGRKWWSEHGASISGAVFDLSPGSYSRRTMLRAIRRKLAAGKMTWED